MKMYQKLAAVLTMTALVCATACNESDNDIDPTPGGEITDGSTLTGNITHDIRLSAGGKFKISGGVHVKAGATLYIEEGVTITAIDDELPDYILIEQGAKINAVGTAQHPIIMTGELKRAGAWGGIHICGYAHTNAGTGVLSEIGNAPYGGTNDADNSGILKYIRLEYTGFALDEEHEANGVSFYGVGNGTTVEYLQAYRGSDDGFEFFGGSVNIKHLVATDCSDDSFDWTEGWNGKGQFLVAYQTPQSTLGYDCDCLMECDNNGKNFSATPIARPTLANVTLVGNSSTTQARGVRLRAGTEVELYNAIITGKTNCITVETDETENALKRASSPSVLAYITMSSPLSSKQNIYTNTDFTTVTSNSTNYNNTLTNKYIGTVSNGKTLSDTFFTAAAYKGAVENGKDWTQGWCL